MKSNTKLSPRHPQWSCHCERPCFFWKGCSQKEIWVLWRAPLFLGKWCGVATYFLYKKIRRRNKIQNYLIKILHCHWLNRNRYNLDKLNLTRLWVLVTIYQKNTWLFVIVTIYPKIKRKTRHRSTYPKELSSKARLLVAEWEGVRHPFRPDRVWSSRL